MPDAPMNTTVTPVTEPPPTAKPAPVPKPVPRDSLRETAETVAFVVALVLMLKLFVVEAFVIPTGSMAETLYGYQKIATCPECGFTFPVNSSNEVDPGDEASRSLVVGACCPNCRDRFRWGRGEELAAPDNRSGDRVLVHKVMYHLRPPEPGDVVVFKYPVDPQLNHTAQNYIKRLWGRGRETLAINRGDLYRTTALTYPADARSPDGRLLYPRPEDPNHLWEGPEVEYHSKTIPRYESTDHDYTYHNAEAAVELFEASRKAGFAAGVGTEFELVRKSDDLVMAMRRPVYHNDYQSRTLARAGVPPRWMADKDGWTPDDPAAPRAFTHAGAELGWVRYRHLAPRTRDEWAHLAAGMPADGMLSPIGNFLGYNAGLEQGRGEFRNSSADYWVGDLMLECDATFAAADAAAVLELSKGPHRYQAIFEGGQVKLIRTGPQGKEMATAPTGITGGTHALRFANVDCRLRVWVDGKRVEFGAAADYPPDPLPAAFDPLDKMEEGWTAANDLAAPASVGAKGGVTFRKLVLWRDTYFTYSDSPFSGIAKFADTFYVQPGHYLCLGDNSAQSSDSRKWGTVPERLLLGKAVAVFWPPPTLWPPSEFRLSQNRIGPIR